MRQCPHTDLVGLSLVSRLLSTAPCAPGALHSICQMREPNSAIPAALNGMVTLGALPFPGNSSIFKSILITQPYAWVFSFYLKARASIRSLGNKMLFILSAWGTICQQSRENRRIWRHRWSHGSWLWVLGPKFSFSNVPHLPKLWSACRWHSPPAWWFSCHPSPPQVCGFSSFQEDY